MKEQYIEKSNGGHRSRPSSGLEDEVESAMQKQGNCVRLTTMPRIERHEADRGSHEQLRVVEGDRAATGAGTGLISAAQKRGWKGLIDELRSRRVFRVAASYVISACASAQIIDLVSDGFGFPSWVLQFYLIAMVIGFPIFLALAWVYQMTSHGLKVHEDVSADEEAGFRAHGLDIAVIVLLIAIVLLVVIAQDPMASSAVTETEFINAP